MLFKQEFCLCLSAADAVSDVADGCIICYIRYKIRCRFAPRAPEQDDFYRRAVGALSQRADQFRRGDAAAAEDGEFDSVRHDTCSSNKNSVCVRRQRMRYRM